MTGQGTGQGVYGCDGAGPGATMNPASDVGLQLSRTAGPCRGAWHEYGSRPRRHLEAVIRMRSSITAGGHPVGPHSRTVGGPP